MARNNGSSQHESESGWCESANATAQLMTIHEKCHFACRLPSWSCWFQRFLQFSVWRKRSIGFGGMSTARRCCSKYVCISSHYLNKWFYICSRSIGQRAVVFGMKMKNRRKSMCRGYIGSSRIYIRIRFWSVRRCAAVRMTVNAISYYI